MAICEYSSSCFFFTRKLVDMPHSADFFREKFCNGEFGTCARFKLSRSVGIENVPDSLPPFNIRGQKCFCGL